MKKLIILIISVIILLITFLFRFQYIHIGAGYFIRVNRITGIAKIYKSEINSGELVDIKQKILKERRIKRKSYALESKKQFKERTDWDLSGLEKEGKK